MDDKIVTFETFYDPMLAEIIRARLEANGIQCFIADSLATGVNPLYNNAMGGIKIKVFETDIEKCRGILSESADLELDDEANAEAITICPYCNSSNVRYGAATERKVDWLISIVSFLYTIYPFYTRKSWHCFNCSRDFK